MSLALPSIVQRAAVLPADAVHAVHAVPSADVGHGFRRLLKERPEEARRIARGAGACAGSVDPRCRPSGTDAAAAAADAAEGVPPPGPDMVAASPIPFPAAAGKMLGSGQKPS